MKKWLRGLAIIFLIFLSVTGGYILRHGSFGVNKTTPPQFIQADFIDLSRIYSISKFRSGEGHDFSGGGETCRSMKHYYTSQYDPNATYQEIDGKRLPPGPDGINDIPIYSPVDGSIVSIEGEHTPIGKQIGIIPRNNPRFLIRLFHIYPDPGIKAGIFGLGGHVKAGQKIGVISKNQGTDIAIQAGAMPWDSNFISYFAVMPDSVFTAYQARGISSRDDLIISKEYRDAHPFQCAYDEGENFVHPADYDRSSDDVHLSGYIAPNYQQSSSSPSTKPK